MFERRELLKNNIEKKKLSVIHVSTTKKANYANYGVNTFCLARGVSIRCFFISHLVGKVDWVS